jgi:hypothetical protein
MYAALSVQHSCSSAATPLARLSFRLAARCALSFLLVEVKNQELVNRIASNPRELPVMNS